MTPALIPVLVTVLVAIVGAACVFFEELVGAVGRAAASVIRWTTIIAAAVSTSVLVTLGLAGVL